MPSAIHRLSRFRLFRAFLGGAEKSPRFSKVAHEISRILKVRYVILGHTHEADLVPMTAAGLQGAEYVNSGTWTKVFTAKLEERLLKQESEFGYVDIDPKKPRMELLRWRDDLDEGERIRLFEAND